MKKLLPFVSLLGLALVILAPALYLAGSTDKQSMTTAMLVGTLLWFGTVPFWLGKKPSE